MKYKIIAFFAFILVGQSGYSQYLNRIEIDSTLTFSRELHFSYNINIPNSFGSSVNVTATNLHLFSNDELVFKDGFTASASNVNYEFSAKIETCPIETVFITTGDVTCNGYIDGSINVSVNNLRFPKLYDWQTHLTFDSTNTNIHAGQHFFSVIDIGGCKLDTTIRIDQPDSIVINPILVNSDCNLSNGSITINAVGGVGAYNYQWSDINQNTPSRLNVSSGIYYITISDQNGCSVNQKIILPSGIADTSKYKILNPTVCIDGYTSLILDSAFKSAIFPDGISMNRIPVGSYDIYFIDTNDCIIQSEINIQEASPITFNAISVNPSCNSSDGAIRLVNIVSNHEYAITWSPLFSDTTFLEDIPAGAYSVTLIDTFQCVYRREIKLDTDSSPHFIIDSIRNPTCFNSNDGYIKVHSPIGAINSYSWNDILDSISERVNLFSGIYNLRIVDANGCSVFHEFTLNTAEPFQVEIATSPAICNTNSGSANIRTKGGVSPYHYIFHGDIIDGNLKNLTAGIDQILILDDRGCSTSKSFEIETSGGPILSDSVISEISQFDLSDGTVLILANGQGPFSYFWPEDSTSSEYKDNLHKGPHDVYATDNLGCKSKISFVLLDPPKIIFTCHTKFDSLSGFWQGRINIETGTAPYTISWDSTITNSIVKSDLTLGEHSVEVSDATGQTVRRNFQILAWDPDQPLLPCANILLPSNCLGRRCSKDIVADFGADNTGVTNSDCAFQKAARFFNNRGGHGILTIPPGTYTVGEQYVDVATGWGREGLHVFPLHDCSDFEIKGISDNNGNPPTIRFEDCLLYGAFDLSFNQRLISGLNNDNGIASYGNLAKVGVFIRFKECQRMKVSNLNIDGNSPNLSYGGHRSEGIQLEACGIFLINTIRSNFNNLNIHHFGEDGVSMYMETRPVSMNNNFTNCKFDSNGRVGFYWSGGSTVNFSNCTFDNNAITRVSSKAADGIDMELNDTQEADIEYGTFTDCQFMFNAAAGMESSPNWIYHVTHHTFLRCTFACYNQKYSVWPRGRDFNFIDCVFYGPVSSAYDDDISSPIHTNNIKFMKQRLGAIGCEFYESYNNFSISGEEEEECVPPTRPNRFKKWLVEFSLRTSGALFQYAYFNSQRKMHLFYTEGGFGTNNTLYENCTADQLGIWSTELGTVRNATIRNSQINCVFGQHYGSAIATSIAYPNVGSFTLNAIYQWNQNFCEFNLLPPTVPDAVNLLYCDNCTTYDDLYCPACEVCEPEKIRNNINKSAFDVIPNPALNQISLNGEFENLTVIIYNALGNIVNTIYLVMPGENIDIQNLSPGLYYVYTSLGESKRIVKL
jgi:hypothetical protein